MPSYSDNYKKRMNKHFNNLNKDKSYYPHSPSPSQPDIEIPRKVIPKKENYNKSTRIYNGDRKKKFDWSFIIISILIVILVIFLINQDINSNYFFVSLIIVGFILFYFIYKHYQKVIFDINPRIVLFIIYFLMIINMFLGSGFYSVEWAFLGFIVAAIIFYDTRIDSRFLILPALLLLGYVPFLLNGKQQLLAEQIAIYVYYFLVVGVGLQCAEYINKKEHLFDFEIFMKETINKINWLIIGVILGITEIIILILNRFYNLELLKWTILYFFSVCMIFYFMKHYVIEK